MFSSSNDTCQTKVNCTEYLKLMFPTLLVVELLRRTGNILITG